MSSSDGFEDAPRTGRQLRACCLLVFVVVVCAGIVTPIGMVSVGSLSAKLAWDNRAAIARGGAEIAINASIDASHLPDDQKERMKQQVERLYREHANGNLTDEQVLAITVLTSVPLVETGLLVYVIDNYLAPSTLPAAEKVDIERQLQRAARASHEGKTTNTLQLSSEIFETDANGEPKMKDSMSDAELRALGARARAIAEDARVPDEPYVIDVAEAMKRMIDKELNATPTP